MSKKSLREAFAKAKPRSAVVDLPGIGEVMVREFTLGEFDELDGDNTSDAKARNVALVLFTPDGAERIFDPSDQDDIEIIKGLGSDIINQMTEALQPKN